jgi:Shedu protein SduA, C-terminal
MEWDIIKVEKILDEIFKKDSETELLELLKQNSFLFYELYSRKIGIQPNFSEVKLGSKYRCDFAWLNDNSDGPEWVLVEIEKPKMKLFTKKDEPTFELNHAIEQVKSWQRYFRENPEQKKLIFGAVSRFRYILVAGDINEWEKENAAKWRLYENENFKLEIRSSNVFYKAIEIAKKDEVALIGFSAYKHSMKFSELEKYWKKLRIYGFLEKNIIKL